MSSLGNLPIRSKTQPDLNWDNPEVSALKCEKHSDFWFDMGVDGMQVDAIWGIKDPDSKDDSPNPDFYGNQDDYGAFIHDHRGRIFREYLRRISVSLVMNITTANGV